MFIPFETSKGVPIPIQFDNSIKSYRFYKHRTDIKTDTFVDPFFPTQGVSKCKDLMEISKMIFHIKPIPSHMMKMWKVKTYFRDKSITNISLKISLRKLYPVLRTFFIATLLRIWLAVTVERVETETFNPRVENRSFNPLYRYRKSDFLRRRYEKFVMCHWRANSFFRYRYQ